MSTFGYLMKQDYIKTKQEFGRKVRYFRRQKSMTQSQLAEMVEKTDETISNIERGATSAGVELMCRLANVLDVPVRDFFDETQGVNPFLDKDKMMLSREILALIEPKSKKYLRSLQTVLKGV